MKPNQGKSHFICSANEKVNLAVENSKIDNSACKKLLGIKFDSKLTFNAHFNQIYTKPAIN